MSPLAEGMFPSTNSIHILRQKMTEGRASSSQRQDTREASEQIDLRGRIRFPLEDNVSFPKLVVL